MKSARLGLVGIVLFLMSGCAPRSTSVTMGNLDHSSATTQPATRSGPAIDVRYSAHSHPAQLSAAQVDEVIAAAREDWPKGRDIWFILVHDNAVYGGERYYAVTVFFTPDQRSARVRRGRYTGVNSMFRDPKLRAKLRELGEDRPRPLAKYVQVSEESYPFLNYADRPAVPDGMLLPFDRPAMLTDGDLIPIVDVARRALAKEARDDASKPVYRIGPSRDGAGWDVWFGWQDGPLYGGGRIVEVRKRGNGYEAGDVGMWVS